MKEVTQARTGMWKGQCTEASVASILEVPLEDVPDLWAGPHVPEDASFDEQRPPERSAALVAWLREKHGRWVCFGKLSPAHPLPLNLENPMFEGLPWDQHHMLGGPNPDGLPHFVVGLNGAVVWDPNPSRRGIVTCDEVWFLVDEWQLRAMGGKDWWPAMQLTSWQQEEGP